MSKTIKLYFVMLFAFLFIDGLWLTLIASGFYQQYLGYLMSPTPNLVAAGLFYLLYIYAGLELVVRPGFATDNLKGTLARAALFGAACYATYDLTNLATIKDWPLIITVVDLIWGTTVSVAISAVGFWYLRKASS